MGKLVVHDILQHLQCISFRVSAFATDSVFFARRGEMASMRSLHLIQNWMVYVNTLMIQKLMAQPHWQGKFTPRDSAALTPLIWEHLSPSGRFDLDMNTRLALA